MCAADAMSMPVHWYYNTPDLRRDFSGWIRRDTHPSSILSLSSTAGSGRSAGSIRTSAPVVGNLILHDKLKFWTDPQGSVHYHQASSEERLKVHQSAVEALGLTCYTKALSSLFYLAYSFHNDATGGILTNTNCGGENCNPGAALGALLGARAVYLGSVVPQEWKNGLIDAQERIADVLQNLNRSTSV